MEKSIEKFAISGRKTSGTGAFVLFLILLHSLIPFNTASGEPPEITDVIIRPTWSYNYLSGSGVFNDADGDEESGTSCRWFVNGVETEPASEPQLLLLHMDGTLESTDGQLPIVAINAGFAPGYMDSCVYLEEGGEIVFPAANNFDPREATVEMWVALRAEASDSIYTEHPQVLFSYNIDSDNSISIEQSQTTKIIHCIGASSGTQFNASSQKAVINHWLPGEWHYLAAVFSESGGYLKFFIDGESMGECTYSAPVGDAQVIRIAGRCCSFESHYFVDEVRIIPRACSKEEIEDAFHRTQPFLNDEIYFRTENLVYGDSIKFEITPCDGNTFGDTVLSAPFVWKGKPIQNLEPNSMLLPPGTSEISMMCKSPEPAQIKYSLDDLLPYSLMIPFETGQGDTVHFTEAGEIDTTSITSTVIYFRSSLDTTFFAYRIFRPLQRCNPSYPRTFNLWGTWDDKSIETIDRLSQIDLWLSSDFWTKEDIYTFRTFNPDIRFLNTTNTCGTIIPENTDYLLKDVDGDPIEAWPGRYRLNLTKPEVAEMQAMKAYEAVLSENLAYDGCFFDNFYTTQSWLTEDCAGNPVQVDADEDGEPDDPDTLDARWRAGVYHMMETFREKMPWALVSGHLISASDDSTVLDFFNGESIFFMTSDVLEGNLDISVLENRYGRWFEGSVSPALTSIEDAPWDEIAYGWGYDPKTDAPESVVEFARDFIPRVRFGLGLTLMHDGYFAYEFGDAWHGNDWWYDELDFDLGAPVGEFENVEVAGVDTSNIVRDYSFENPYLFDDWKFRIRWIVGTDAVVERDTTEAFSGEASAKITVWDTGSGGENNVSLSQENMTIANETEYIVSFAAKGELAQTIRVRTVKQDTTVKIVYGLDESIDIDPEWREYETRWIATSSASDCKLEFLLGDTTGVVFLDEINFREAQPHVLTREFENGRVYLNGSPEKFTFAVPSGLSRLVGDQAPMYQYIIDNSDDGFSVDGPFEISYYDTGTWQLNGPYYHDWGEDCITIPSGTTASMELNIPAPDFYTVKVWWPAGPDLWKLSHNVEFKVVDSGGSATFIDTTLNQSVGGNEWVYIGKAFMAPGDSTRLTISCPDRGALADAVYLESDSRFNNGSTVSDSLSLDGFDAIILKKDAPAEGSGENPGISVERFRKPHQNGKFLMFRPSGQTSKDKMKILK